MECLLQQIDQLQLFGPVLEIRAVKSFALHLENPYCSASPFIHLEGEARRPFRRVQDPAKGLPGAAAVGPLIQWGTVRADRPVQAFALCDWR
jgi:hypothetical protein